MITFFKLTDKCMMTCRYCYYSTGHLKRDTQNNHRYSLEEIGEAIVRIGSRSVILTGGDPLHKSVMDSSLSLLKYYQDRGVATGINTSLALKNERDIERLVDVNPGIVYVSCDSHKPNIHDKQRMFGKITLSTLEKISKKGVKVSISCSLTSVNYQLIREMWKYFCDNGIGHVDFSIAYIPSSHHEYKKLSCECLSFEERKRLADDLIWWAEQTSDDKTKLYVSLQSFYFLGIKTGKSFQEKMRCQMGQKIIIVDENGEMYPCFHRNIKRKNIMLKTHGVFNYFCRHKDFLPNCFGKHCLSLFIIKSFWKGGDVDGTD